MPEFDNTPADCQCLRHELRTRRIRGGGIQYIRQCLDCGSSVGNAVASTKLGAVLPPRWNEELAAQYQERRRQRYEQEREERELERQQENEAWRAEYDRHLQSPEWRERRTLVLERERYVCQGCMRNRATEVHHASYRTYNRTGRELLFELVALCRECHAIAHTDADA